MKERYAVTELRKQANRMNFGEVMLIFDYIAHNHDILANIISLIIFFSSLVKRRYIPE